MTITNYHAGKNEDGEQETRFQIRHESFGPVRERLREKGFNPGSQEDVGDGQSEIWVTEHSIEEINGAIADIPGEP
jgi:hypothetical protein